MERHSLPVTVFAQFGKEISMELTVVLAGIPVRLSLRSPA